MPGWGGTMLSLCMDSGVRVVSAGCRRVNCLRRLLSTSRTVRTSSWGRLSSATSSAVTAKVLMPLVWPG
ncbi:hypothetical protein D3C80_1850880 [compost metagenome]